MTSLSMIAIPLDWERCPYAVHNAVGCCTHQPSDTTHNQSRSKDNVNWDEWTLISDRTFLDDIVPIFKIDKTPWNHTKSHVVVHFFFFFCYFHEFLESFIKLSSNDKWFFV